MIYPLVIGTIMRQWSVGAGEAGLAATATLLASAVGGWAAGLLSDRIGRVRTLQITIVWFSFFSLLCAFAQNFQQLLVLRTLLGFGFGGESASLETIGKELGLTRERVRQLESEALHRLQLELGDELVWAA